MSKFAAALNARQQSPTGQSEPLDPLTSAQPVDKGDDRAERLTPVTRKVGRPAGKRSNEANTQVTAYVPAQLYYDVRIKLLERKRKNKKASADFSDLLHEWMERWLAEQA